MNNFLPFNTDNLPNRYIGIQIHRYNNILVDRITALEAECAMLRRRLRDPQDQGAGLRVWIAQLLELRDIQVIEQLEESGMESDVEVDVGVDEESNDSFTTAESEGLTVGEANVGGQVQEV